VIAANICRREPQRGHFRTSLDQTRIIAVLARVDRELVQGGLQRAALDHRADPLVTGELQRVDDADAVEESGTAAGDDALFDRRARRVERVLTPRRGAQR
jgi:hypothetical protein